MSKRVVVLGAGFGGLELSTMLSEAVGDRVEVTLIDKSDAFTFGYSKLDVMFGRTSPESVRLPYAQIEKRGVRFAQETITAIDPEAKTVTTDAGTHEADVLVVALGADYDFDATPGLADSTEFYSNQGAADLAEIVPTFTEGRAIVGVCGAPFKCPPAPSECALMLHDYLTERGIRDKCEITFAVPLPSPVPPAPDASAALRAEFEQRGIELITGQRVAAIEDGAAVLGDGTRLPFDLFLGVPKHRAPDVVIESGMAEDGYIPVDTATLATRYPDVYAVGDVATAGVPKAGVFAEGAARIVAQRLIADLGAGDPPGPHLGRGACYIEFGDGRVARVDIDFLSGPNKTGTFQPPSMELTAEKEQFGSARRASWFGL